MQLLHFAAGGGDGGFVETAHPGRHVAGADPRQPFEGEPGELEAAVAGGAAQRRGAHAVVARRGGIVATEQRDLAVAQQQPPVLGPVLVPPEQAARALQPSGGDGRIAAEREVVPHEPQRHAGGAERVVVLAVQPVGALARVEGEAGIVEPPRGEAELLQRLGRLAGG